MGYLFGYLRFSADKNGTGENVADQERWFREFAAGKFPGVSVKVWCDNNVSAAKDDVVRPEFDAMNAAIGRGECVALWCSEQTRLERRLIPWLQYADWLCAHGVVEVHTRRDGLIRLGDVMSDLKGVLAADEIRRLRTRVRDKQDEHAAQGRPGGGVTFGYRHTIDATSMRKVLVVVPEQAELIREAASRVLAGESLAGIAKDFTRRGQVGARGGELGAASVKSWVTAPTVAGKRQHRGQIVGDGDWEPIVSEDVWRACCAKLARQKERKERPGRRTYLLAGLVVCGKEGCEGRRMVGARKALRGRYVPTYLCKSCYSTMLAEAVEDHVSSELLARLDDLVDLRTPADEHDARRAEITTELATFDEKRRLYGVMLADDDMDVATYQSARERLSARERELTTELADLPTLDEQVDPDAVRTGWAGNTVDERRALISLFVERVVINRPAQGAARKIDLGRVSIVGPGWE